MIYITVGTHPNGFDELIKIFDSIAFENRSLKIIAQIANGKYKPKYFEYFNFLSREKHLSYLKKSEFIVTHGGLASIAESSLFKKKIIVYPRKIYVHDQVSSAKLLNKFYSFRLASSKDEIKFVLTNFKNSKEKKTKQSNVGTIIGNHLEKVF
jgi:UDP-N-acetylglucosamine transferase subunit ALG13